MLLSWIKGLLRKPRYRSLGWVNLYEDQNRGGKRWTSRAFKSKKNAIKGRHPHPKSIYLDTVEIFTKEEVR